MQSAVCSNCAGTSIICHVLYCYLSEHPLKSCSIGSDFVYRRRLRYCCQIYNLGDFDQESLPAQLAQCFRPSFHRNIDRRELEGYILYMVNNYWGRGCMQGGFAYSCLNLPEKDDIPDFATAEFRIFCMEAALLRCNTWLQVSDCRFCNLQIIHQFLSFHRLHSPAFPPTKTTLSCSLVHQLSAA